MPDQNQDANWDELFTSEPPVVVNPDVDPPIPDNPTIENPVATTDTELEDLAKAPVDPDALDPNEPEPDLQREPEEIKPTEEPEKPSEKPPEEQPVEMSGIELYLAQFDVEGGMINFDDGDAKHFSELSPEKQAEVLDQLHSTQTKTVEEKYGLDENEVGLINYLRTNNLSVEQMVEDMASQRVSTLMAVQQLETEDYDTMEEDSVYLRFLRGANPNATVEELEADLSKAKELANYGNIVTGLRSQYKAQQKYQIDYTIQRQQQEQNQLIDDQRQQVVGAVSGIGDIAGIKLNDNVKNSLLDQVLEVNDNGDSRFMEEVFGDPVRLFNAAFWYYHGKDIMSQRDTYWRQEKSKAYKRGREEALGKDGTRISFTDRTKTKPTGPGNAKDEALDWLDLHND